MCGWSADEAGGGSVMQVRSEIAETEAALAQMRLLIDRGGYAAGDRLPPERQLIEQVGVSRSVLRKALDTLEREGAIWRHVGKGTFVARAQHLNGAAAAPDGAGAVDGVARLARQTTPFKMMRARLAIETAITREAAINASAEALTRMNLAMQRARAAASWREYEVQDDLFHRSLAEACDNPPMLALFDQLNAIRRAVALGNVQRSSARPPAAHTSFAEHEEIARAVAARDPEAAAAAMRRHLQSVASRLFGD
jgi:DNA-binding FadR family transcriptional regulator